MNTKWTLWEAPHKHPYKQQVFVNFNGFEHASPIICIFPRKDAKHFSAHMTTPFFLSFNLQYINICNICLFWPNLILCSHSTLLPLQSGFIPLQLNFKLTARSQWIFCHFFVAFYIAGQALSFLYRSLVP